MSPAKELNDSNALGLALWHAAVLAAYGHNPAEVERLASDLIELSTRQSFTTWLPRGAVLRGWARSTSGETAEGISLIEEGIEDYQATGEMLDMPLLLALKAESLHLADRTPEALEAIAEAEVLIERFENRYWCAELHRLRAVFLTAMVQMTLKFTLLSVKPSARQISKNRFHSRCGRKRATLGTGRRPG
jgi:predicted ATPase